MTLAMNQSSALLVMWIVFSSMALAGVIAVLVWAIRTRQFANQDRARYLALQAGIPKDEDKDKKEGGAKDEPSDC